MLQLDAMFADEGIFSTETQVVSAETADPDQVWFSHVTCQIWNACVS